MRKEHKVSPLSPLPNGKRPNVLLVGNGINLSFDNAQYVNKIVESIWKKKHEETMPDSVKNMTLPMQIVVASKDCVDECMGDLANGFRNTNIDRKQKPFIKKILDSGFDSILTTNYSFEFERSVINDFTIRKFQMNYRYTRSDSYDKFGIFQYINLPYENNPPIWHIHGNASRKNSMVMGQYYYGELLSNVVMAAKNTLKRFRTSKSKNIPFKPLSWVDYFLIGDVYSFGFKFDLSESDIWWLLSFKKYYFGETRVYYYEANKVDDDKLHMLEAYEVKMPKDIVLHDNEYVRFYCEVLDSILIDLKR